MLGDVRREIGSYLVEMEQLNVGFSRYLWMVQARMIFGTEKWNDFDNREGSSCERNTG